jgi:hypothetical protein
MCPHSMLLLSKDVPLLVSERDNRTHGEWSADLVDSVKEFHGL